MKLQDLFPMKKNNKKYLKMLSAATVTGALRFKKLWCPNI